MKAREMSSMCTIGRHGVPSLFRYTLPDVTAQATRLLSTTSKRMRGERPYAVAHRRNVGENELSARGDTSCSVRTFETPYGVTGFSSEVSSTGASPAAP